MSYLGGKKLAWGNKDYFEYDGMQSTSPYLNYYKWSNFGQVPDYTYARAITSNSQDYDYSLTTGNFYKKIWRESDVVAGMTSDGTSYVNDGYVITGTYGSAGNYVPRARDGNIYIMEYGFNSYCELVGVRFVLPFYDGAFCHYTIASQKYSIFYFALIPATSNPSGYKDVKIFNFTLDEYNNNWVTIYDTSHPSIPSQSGEWFKNKLQDALGQSIYNDGTSGISCLTSSDYTMQIRTGMNTFYILILYRIDYQFTYAGSAIPSHIFLRVNTNKGTAVAITSKTGDYKTYNIPTDYQKLTIYYKWNWAFAVNSLNQLYSKRIDPY